MKESKIEYVDVDVLGKKRINLEKEFLKFRKFFYIYLMVICLDLLLIIYLLYLSLSASGVI